MPLLMKPACEKCAASTPPEAAAFICIYECTWCPKCTEGFGRVCPNCKGELVLRPRKGLTPAAPSEPNFDGVVARHHGDAPSKPWPKGITLKTLWSEPGGRRALQVDFAPGSRWEGLDVHLPGPEAVYVISGVFNDGRNDYPAGTFIHHPAGTAHTPQSAQGCSLFVFYPDA